MLAGAPLRDAIKARHGVDLGWNAADTQAALVQARAVSGPPLGWFSPTWWRLRRLLNERYNFAAHAVVPSWTQILGELESAHASEAAVTEVRERATREFGTGELAGLLAEVEAFHAAGAGAPAFVRAFHERLGGSDAVAAVKVLVTAEPAFRELRAALPHLLVEFLYHLRTNVFILRSKNAQYRTLN